MKTKKTYNIELGDTIEVQEAVDCKVTPSGCLVFIDISGSVVQGFNHYEWTRFWVIE